MGAFPHLSWLPATVTETWTPGAWGPALGSHRERGSGTGEWTWLLAYLPLERGHHGPVTRLV